VLDSNTLVQLNCAVSEQTQYITQCKNPKDHHWYICCENLRTYTGYGGDPVRILCL